MARAAPTAAGMGVAQHVFEGDDFIDYSIKPMQRITAALKEKHPGIPVIAFPREAGEKYIGFAKATGADCVALDNSVSPEWAAEHVQVDGCVQGNLDPKHMVTGGQALVDATREVVEAFKNGPHIFNLGHGITPDVDPEQVAALGSAFDALTKRIIRRRIAVDKKRPDGRGTEEIRPIHGSGQRLEKLLVEKTEKWIEIYTSPRKL